MISSVDPSRFPSLETSVRAYWAPILLEPITGSYERFVIGVAVANERGFHVELANALDRLKCFYGADALALVNVIALAGDCLRQDLAARSVDALRMPDPPISGITLGECREGEGRSLQGLAQSWMSALSSIYMPVSGDAFVLRDEPARMVADEAEAARSGDRLPFLVCEYVKAEREGYGRYFSADLRDGKARRAKGGSHRVVVDFAGPALVANFGTLKAGSITSSVHLIKRRLWDLKVDRDREPNAALARAHEMILHRPAKDDPQITEVQQSNIGEALEDLEQQADQVELRLLALDNVPAIVQRILQYSLAA